VLGDGAAGKSTFIKTFVEYLRVNRVVNYTERVHLSTKGISFVEAKLNGDRDVTLRFVEFGGQPQYLPIHRSFIDSINSLYVVLYRADVGSAHQGVQFWLDYVASLRGLRNLDESYSSNVLLLSTHNDNAKVAPAAQVVKEGLLNDKSPLGLDRANRFDLHKMKAFDLDYASHSHVEVIFRDLNEFALKTVEKLDSLPTSFAQFLTKCKEVTSRKGHDYSIIELEELNSQFQGSTRLVCDALKFFTQMGDIVYVPGMKYVFTDPRYFFLALGTIANSEQLMMHGGICSTKTVSELLGKTEELTENLLDAMSRLNLCFAVPTTSVQFGSDSNGWNVRLYNEESVDQCHWMFPACRNDTSSRHELLAKLERTGQLSVRPCRYGVRFKTKNGFLPPGLMPLAESYLRKIGEVVHTTSNTVVICFSTKNRVIMHYNADGKTPFIDCVVCSDSTLDCRQVLDTVSVRLSRCIDVYFPQLDLVEYALCNNCLGRLDCRLHGVCELARSARSGEYTAYSMDTQRSVVYQCDRPDKVALSDLIPFVKEQSAWRKCWEFDVMISHAGENTSLALDIYKWLSNLGVRCFLDETHLAHTADADSVLAPLMDKCRFCICVATDAYCVKRWPILEFQHFLEREESQARRSLLPVLIDMDPRDFEKRAKVECRWTSYGALMVLQSKHLNGKGRVDSTPGRAAFNALELSEICQKVCNILAESRELHRSEGSSIGAPVELAESRELHRSEGSSIGAPVEPLKDSVKKYDAFVSYAGEDKERLAIPLVRSLKVNNWEAFYDRDSIRAAGDIRISIYEAIHNSKVGIFILSEHFFERLGHG
jgi:hypothetical protein